MSIGKNSIARAVNATATLKTATANSTVGNAASFPIENIGLLSIAKTPDGIESIKKSIEKHGVLCPVLVCATASGDIWLIDGYRRLSAAKEVGISQINAVVVNVNNKRDANGLYAEIRKTEKPQKSDNIYEEKFRILCVKDRDLPPYLL